MSSSNIIGKSYTRPDGPDKTTGKTKFITDIKVENLVYGHPIYSQIPFGKIKSIDITEAKKVRGFCCLFFADDIPGENQIGVILKDQPLFAEKIVRFIGDSIGIAIGESESAAKLIAEKVKIKYEEYEPYFSINKSKSATNNFIHDNNIACEHQSLKGNVNNGFTESKHIIEADFKTPAQEHYYLEPQGCIAIPRSDGIEIHGSLQCPYYIQKSVAIVLGINIDKVIVIQSPTGGAFGGKEDIPSELAARAAVAAKRLNRPVKMIYNRHDDVQLTSKRHPFQMHYKVGVAEDGELLTAEINLEESAGAFATLSSVVSYRSTIQAMGPYVIPNIRVKSTSYYTNLPPNGAFRGFGSPQATFGHERMMDIIASKIGIDPIELRLKNVLRPGDATSTNHKLTASVGIKETIEKSAEAARWYHRRNGRKNNDRYLYGVGIGASHYGNCLGAAGWHMDGAGANIQLNRDGTVSVAYGLIDMGQGAITVVTQMTAETLGIDPNRITVLPTDTRNVPDSGPSVASRNVVMTGNAIRNAAGKLLPVLHSAGADILNCVRDSIKIENDNVSNNMNDNIINFGDLIEFIYNNNPSLQLSNYLIQKDGWWHTPKLDYNADIGQGEAYFTYSYATHIAKVRVDKLTGLVKVKKVWAVHDVGKAINPAGVEAQVEGGIAQGIGYALTENFKVHRGKVLTDNLSTYLLPTALDISEVETIIVEDPEPLGPWGAKGIGEPAIIPTAAAIANAVSNAIGKPINEIPISPEKVLEILDNI
ncbi:xanthine dehydrogenase family protein molybdopterin-binding subunit [Candidatus Neomarinimicrobiota bacterium]